MKTGLLKAVLTLCLTSLLIVPINGKSISKDLEESEIQPCSSTPETNSQQDNIIEFPDRILESEVRAQIGKPEGRIRVEDVASIKSLAINNKKITSLEGLQYLTDLESLILKGAEIIDITLVGRLSGLKALDLSYNQIDDIRALSKLTNLKELILDSNQIVDIKPLEDLVNLEKLSLYSNRIESIEPLSSLTKLSVLNLYINQIEVIKPLENLTGLKELFLGNNGISDLTPLDSLTELKVLEANQNNIVSLAGMSGLINLEELYLLNNRIESPDELGSLANLRYLDLSDNNIKSVASLHNLILLENLALDQNRISDTSGMENLVQLKTLRMGSNEISNVKGLGTLRELTSLSLRNNKITDIAGLSLLKNLINLDISNNQIKDISELRGLPNLSLASMGLEGNPLPDYIFQDVLKEEFILALIYPNISDAIKSYYGGSRAYMNQRILSFEKAGGKFKVKVWLETYTGAHNPPYGTDTLTFSMDYSGIALQEFVHEEVPPWKTYYNDEYKVTFKYPPDWEEDTKYFPDEHYSGKDGYFSIGAVSGGDYLTAYPIDEVARLHACHKLMPFGSQPEIKPLKIDGREARLIIPSPDQPGTAGYFSELVVEYPGPVDINGTIYHYFILEADNDHILDIAKTLRFVFLTE